MRGPNSKAARALLRQDMPLGEVRAVLEAADPAVVRRYLELHRERLEEQIAERRRVLDVVERMLTESLVANDNAKTPARPREPVQPSPGSTSASGRLYRRMRSG
jgi:DNA-binding transcriptional MerR regulator